MQSIDNKDIVCAKCGKRLGDRDVIQQPPAEVMVGKTHSILRRDLTPGLAVCAGCGHFTKWLRNQADL